MSGVGVPEGSDVKLAVDLLLVWMLVRWRICAFFVLDEENVTDMSFVG